MKLAYISVLSPEEHVHVELEGDYNKRKNCFIYTRLDFYGTLQKHKAKSYQKWLYPLNLDIPFNYYNTKKSSVGVIITLDKEGFQIYGDTNVKLKLEDCIVRQTKSTMKVMSIIKPISYKVTTISFQSTLLDKLLCQLVNKSPHNVNLVEKGREITPQISYLNDLLKNVKLSKKEKKLIYDKI